MNTPNPLGCDHWERTSPAFCGHCSHASCPNYMDSCPVHQNYGFPDPHGLPPGECTLKVTEETPS